LLQLLFFLPVLDLLKAREQKDKAAEKPVVD
jgi:hypothetical protein